MVSLTKKTGHKLECLLCPHFCKLYEGKTGICGARTNTGNKIELIPYELVSGYSLDPVEKKPLYHFYPGTKILSIGSFGCNMRCDFCQNFDISQTVPQTPIPNKTPEKIVKEAVSTSGNLGLAFTYNEPSISFEFVIDTAILAKEKGLCTVIVSNGYVNSEPLDELIRYIDAFNIDLKAFNNDFYRRLAGAEIEPVKSTLKQIVQSGRHLEITTLIIPGENDDEQEMASQAKWIAGELGKDVPLHLSKYYPGYRRNDPPTPDEILIRLAGIASSALTNVYIGNTGSDLYQDTICPGCKTIVTRRSNYDIFISSLDENGNCTKCRTKVYKYFKPSFLSGN